MFQFNALRNIVVRVSTSLIKTFLPGPSLGLRKTIMKNLLSIKNISQTAIITSLMSAMCTAISPAVFAGDYSTFLKFESSLLQDQQQILREDINRLNDFKAVIRDEQMIRIMGFPGPVNSDWLVYWLQQRLQYVVKEDFKLDQSSIYVAQSGYSFDNQNDNPTLPQVLKTPESTPNSQVQTVMTNIGGAVYFAGKTSGNLLGLKIDGIGNVSLTSPRVGVLKVGSGLFSILRNHKGTQIHDLDNSYLRLSVLFHEARHSDGHGKSLGFFHAVCPPGHSYAGFAACDANLNGAYTVGAYVGKALAENCSQCTIAQKQALRLDYLDAFDRVLQSVPDPNAMDPTVLIGAVDACDSLKAANLPEDPSCINFRQQLKDTQSGKTPGIQSVDWDAAPEGNLK